MGDLASCGPRRLRYRVSEPSPCGVYTAGVTGAFVLSRARREAGSYGEQGGSN